MTGAVIHDHWRSSAACRVGAALALKAAGYRSVSGDLPQLFDAGRFAADLSAFPEAFAASERVHIHPAFGAGHPSNPTDGDAP